MNDEAPAAALEDMTAAQLVAAASEARHAAGLEAGQHFESEYTRELARRNPPPPTPRQPRPAPERTRSARSPYPPAFDRDRPRAGNGYRSRR